MMHGMHGYGPIAMILFWIVLIGFGIYLIVNYTKGNSPTENTNRHAHKQKETHIQILQKRLAKGEIDEAEYERLKKIIERDNE